MKLVYASELASQIKRLLNMTGVPADQHQSNACFCIHQLRVRRPGDPTVYRVLIAPAEAPLHIGNLPIDQHFLERMTDDPQHISEQVANVMATIYEQHQASGSISEPRGCDGASVNQNERGDIQKQAPLENKTERSTAGGASAPSATGAAE